MPCYRPDFLVQHTLRPEARSSFREPTQLGAIRQSVDDSWPPILQVVEGQSGGIRKSEDRSCLPVQRLRSRTRLSAVRKPIPAPSHTKRLLSFGSTLSCGGVRITAARWQLIVSFSFSWKSRTSASHSCGRSSIWTPMSFSTGSLGSAFYSG